MSTTKSSTKQIAKAKRNGNASLVPRFSTCKLETGWGIKYDQDWILRCHRSDKEFVSSDKKIINYVVNKLNLHLRFNVRSHSIIDGTCNSYCILSHHIVHQLEKPQERFWRRFVLTSLVRDKTFQRKIYEETHGRFGNISSPFAYFLRAHPGFMVPGLNDKSPVYDKQNSAMEQYLDETLLGELTSLTNLERTTVYHLTNMFDAHFTLNLMLVQKRVTLDEYIKGALVAGEMHPGMIKYNPVSSDTATRVLQYVGEEILDWLKQIAVKKIS